MAGTMPFVYEKGPVWEWFDAHFGTTDPRSLTRHERVDLVNRLRCEPAQGQPLVDGGDPIRWRDHFINASLQGPASRLWDAPHLNDAAGAGPFSIQDHFVNDWLAGGAGWVGWSQDPIEIIAKGFLRALEISLGLEPSAGPGTTKCAGGQNSPPISVADTTRMWPIEFIWVCPLPVWQVWIDWRTGGGGDGRVTVAWATPAPAKSYLAETITDAGRNGQPLTNANLSWKNSSQRGLLVVGHATTKVSKPVEPVPDDGIDPVEPEPDGWINPSQHEPDNELDLTLNDVVGSGSIVIVSPYTDVGGANEQRPAPGGAPPGGGGNNPGGPQ